MSKFSKIRRILWIPLLLLACSVDASPLLREVGLAGPPPDPFVHYRTALQPWAQTHIEEYGPFLRYHITATLSEDEEQIKGVTTVTIPAPLPSELVFRLYPNVNNYDGSIEVTGVYLNETPATIETFAENTAIRVSVPPEQTEPLSVRVNFTTAIGGSRNPTDSDFTLFGWDGDILNLPNFYPTLAARQNSTWITETPPLHGDVIFNEAALYQLDLTLPRELVVVGSGTALNVIDNEGGTRTWQFAGGPLRDMSIIAGPFQAVSETASGTVVTSYYLPGHETAAQIVLQHATAAMNHYSTLYGPYPYTELDVIEAPLGVRGMEYSGLVLIGETLYIEQPEFLTYLVAHEVGHQWWYNVVTNNPYEDPWLDEGLTEFSAFDYTRATFDEATAQRMLTDRWYIAYADAAAGGIDGTVDLPADAFDPLDYELLAYTKAALFFETLRLELGDEMFKQVIQTYYNENRYGITTPEAFFETAERVSGYDIEPLVEAWLR